MVTRILVTGFEPFGGSHVNPSEQLVRRLAELGVADVDLRTCILPCAWGEARRQMAAEIDGVEPDAIISFGQGGGASIAVERVGVNLEDAGPDNFGRRPEGTPILPGGPAAYFSTLPVKEIAQAVNAAGIPARLSLSAGAFICNDILYSTQHHLTQRGLTIPAGFIHVPKLPEQVTRDDFREKEPSMGLETLVRAAQVALQVVATRVPVAAR